jgi:hypothetical protein
MTAEDLRRSGALGGFHCRWLAAQLDFPALILPFRRWQSLARLRQYDLARFDYWPPTTPGTAAT